MDARVFAALSLMEDKKLIGDLQAYADGLTRSIAFYSIVEQELLPSLWQGGQSILSGELILLIQEKHKIDFHPICRHYQVDLAADRQYCYYWGKLETICAAPHVYVCYWKSGLFDRGIIPSIGLSWSGQSFLREICSQCRQLCDLAEE